MRQRSKKGKYLIVSALFCGMAGTYPCNAQSPIGTVVAGDASVQGSVMVVSGGTTVLSGSSVTAGNDAAALKLTRGGEILVCPHSQLSLTNSRSGRDLVFGMSTGAIETHYTAGTTADTILTPDFRILLAGPGTFHFGVGADARGNTCIRSLEGNTSSIIVTELMGEGVFQVRPGEQAFFRGGNISNVSQNVPPDCGCPAPAPIMMARGDEAAPSPARLPAFPIPEVPAPPAPASPETEISAAKPIEFPANSPEALIAKHGTPTAAAAPTASDNEIHIQVDAPFVFRGGEDDVPPPPTVVRLALASGGPLLVSTHVLPPPNPAAANATRSTGTSTSSTEKSGKRGFFGHIRSFFAAIFK